MTIESIALNTYFGVELFSSEQPQHVASVICKTGEEAKTLFRRLEVLDIIFVGGHRFARCRSDLINPYPILDLLAVRGRAVIVAVPKSGYQARFRDGRRGPVAQMIMHTSPKLGQRVSYRGPKIKLWQRQFE